MGKRDYGHSVLGPVGGRGWAKVALGLLCQEGAWGRLKEHK